MASNEYDVKKIVDHNYLSAECTFFPSNAIVEEGKCLIGIGESTLILTRPRNRRCCPDSQILYRIRRMQACWPRNYLYYARQD